MTDDSIVELTMKIEQFVAVWKVYKQNKCTPVP